MSEPLTRTVKALTLNLLLLTMTTTSTPAAEWEKLPPLPEPNGGAICGAIESRILIAGGTNWEGGTKNWLRSVYEYDPARKIWSRQPNLPDGPVAYAVAMKTPAGFGYLGGSDGTQVLKTFAFNSGHGFRTQPQPDLPPSLVLAAGGAVGPNYVIVGGTDDAANVAGVQRRTYIVEPFWRGPKVTQVTRMADYPGPGIAVAASVVVWPELFVFGGMDWDAAAQEVRNRTEAHAFSPAKNAWRKLQPLATAVRGLTGVALDERHIYLAGGFTEVFTAEAFLYDIEADTYRPAKALPYAGMAPLVQSAGYLYCLGGEDKMKSRTDKFYRISVAELLQ